MSSHDDLQDDFDRGVKNRRAVLGDAWVDKSLGNATEFNAEFQSFITRYAWNDIWGRPGLDHTTRRLLVLGMTMGLARWEEFELHCAAAIRGGVPLEKIKETLMQGAIYCGVPAANTAFKITTDLLREHGLTSAPQPLTADARVAVHHTFSRPQLKLAVQGSAGPAGSAAAPAGAHAAPIGSDAAPAGSTAVLGPGPAPIVLSHALGLDLRMWDDFAAELAAAGHAVLRYDHRGHGGSAAPAGPYAMDDLVDDAARLLAEWGCGPVVWVGLSMGGMVGQGLAVRHPGLLRGLVLANTVAKYPPAAAAGWEQRIAAVEQGGMGAIVDQVMARYFHPRFRAERADVVAGFERTVRRSDPAGYVACCHAVAGVDWLDRLDAVRCPTLVIAGADDVGAPPALAEAIAVRIAGAELAVIDDAAHLSIAEQPEAFGRLLRGFLDGWPR